MWGWPVDLDMYCRSPRNRKGAMQWSPTTEEPLQVWNWVCFGNKPSFPWFSKFPRSLWNMFSVFFFVVKDQNTSNMTTPAKIVAWKMILSFWEMDPFFERDDMRLFFPGLYVKHWLLEDIISPKPGGSSIGNRCDADGGTTLAWRWRRHFCWRFKMGAPLGNSWLKVKLIEKTMRVFEKSFFSSICPMATGFTP